MRVCATVNAACVGILLAVATFAACAGSSTSSPPGGGTNTPGATEPGSPQSGPGQTDTPAAGDPAAAEAKPPAKPPETVADCKQMLTEITNDPPAGSVVMNNATVADAGSTRFQPMMDLIKEKRESFRCCFDLWAKNHPGVNGRVILSFKLKPDGTLIKAEIDKTDSTITVPEVESCMVEVAKAITYPKSPAGMETTYRHPFDFKAKR